MTLFARCMGASAGTLAWLFATAAHGAFVWSGSAQGALRIDTTAATSQTVPDLGRVDAILPLPNGGAWVRTGNEMVRIAPDLRIVSRVSIASVSAFHWDPQTQRLWVAAGVELLRFDEELRLVGASRFESPIRGISGTGPEAVWAVTDNALLRIGSDGRTRQTLEMAAVSSGAPIAGLLADQARATLWLLHTNGDAIAFDVAGAPHVSARVALPPGSRGVSLDPTSGRIVVHSDAGSHLLGTAADARNALPSGSVAVLRLSGDPSIAIEGTVLPLHAASEHLWHLQASEAVTLGIDDVALVPGVGIARMAIAAHARCGPHPCSNADPLLATLEAEVSLAGRTLRGRADRSTGRWMLDVDLDPPVGPAMHPLGVTLVDGFGNHSAAEAFLLEIDSEGRARLERIAPMATPSVSITSPTNNAVFVAPASITISAIAAVTGATLTKVEFYRNGTLLATDTASPYTHAWTNVAVGTYALTAKAYDSTGGTATSSTVNVTVRANVGPTVSLTGPANNSVFTAPATIGLAATAGDTDGTISKVEFFYGATRIATDTAAPFQHSWTNVAGGSYALTAKATDDKGAVTTSTPVNIIVNRLPAIAMTAPANNAVLVAPVNVTITAAASDMDGTVSRVEFYRGTSLVATDTTAPYSYVWNSVPLGMHTLTAKAYDNRGAVATSSPVTFTVNANVGPSIAITSPAPGARFVHPAAIPITATATDPDGTIARVEFHYDYGLIGSDSSSPYGITWNSPHTGTVALTAKAVDNKGAYASSAPISIGIDYNQAPVVVLTGDPPEGELVTTTPPTFRLTATASDPDGSVASVHFVHLDDYGEEIAALGTITQPPYTVAYTPAALATSYSFRAEATDNLGEVGSAVISYTVTSNSPPSIATVEPGAINPNMLIAPATVVIVADARDFTPSDRVVRVDFVADGNVIGTLTAPNGSRGEYVHVWRNLPAGDHQIRVRAFDTFGALGESASRSVRATAAATPPTVSIVQPITGQVYGDPVPLQVSLTHGSTAISHVDYVNAIGSKVGTSSVPPYGASWVTPSAGRHALTAVAVDVNGQATASPTVFFDVAAVGVKQAPLVVLTSPIALGTVSADTPITVAADAQAFSATLSKVEFFNAGALIGTATSAPYRIDWSNAPLGKATLTAKATDSSAPAALSSAVSSPITVTIASANARPLVSLTAPASAAMFAPPATINLAATASDPNGSVAKVEFFAGTTLIGTDTTSPYTATWTGVPLGSYTLTARATDNLGATTTSVPVNVTVSNPAIALEFPTVGARVSNRSPFALRATASTPGHPIARIEFYDGATLVGTVPFVGTSTTVSASYTWTNAPVGSHSISARVIGTDGFALSSPSRTMTVTDFSLTIYEPFVGQVFAAAGDLRIAAAPVLSDASVARVDFFGDGAYLGTRTSSPFEWLWRGALAGTRQIDVNATDSLGLMVTIRRTINLVAQPAIVVDGGIDGSSIDDDTLTISGRVQASPGSALILDGQRVAVRPDGTWYAQAQLAPGTNTLPLTLNLHGAAPVLRNLTLNSTAVRPFELHVNPASGLAPFETRAILTNRGNVPFQRILVDATDDGTAEMTLTSLPGGSTEIALTYRTIGVHTLSILVQDSAGGTIQRLTRKVVVEDPATLGRSIVGVYKSMTDRLATNEPTRALDFFTGAVQSRYGDVFTALAGSLPQVASQLGTVVDGVITDDWAELTLRRGTTGGGELFNVYLIRSEDGLWRIDSM